MSIVVIGGTHHNSLGVIRALGERQYNVEFINFSCTSKDYIKASKYISHYKALPNIELLKDFLLSRKKTEAKEVIISCADVVTEYLNIHLNDLKENYYIPGVPLEGKMVELMDKTTMIKMVGKQGIVAPFIWNLPEQRSLVELPCITKVHVSSHGGKSDIIICKTQEELNDFLKKNTDNIFAQAFINKKEEVQFIGCALNDGKQVIIPGMSKVLRSQPNTNTGFLEYGPIDPFYNDTVERAKQYIKDCEYSGLFSFEIMRGHDDRIWFLEINFRNDGNAWCTTKAGINLPLIWVKACLGEDYTNEIHTPKKILMMPEFQDFKLVLQRKISLLQWFKDWKRTDYFMEYDKKDQKPFWQYIKDKIF